MGKKTINQEFYTCNAVLQKWRRDKHFPEQTKTEGVFTNRPDLQEILKGVL